jgi:hypothetical protein
MDIEKIMYIIFRRSLSYLDIDYSMKPDRIISYV